MSDFTGKKIANTYKNLLQVDAGNTDLTTNLLSIQTGAGNNTPLQLSTDKINLTGTLQIDGTTLSATAAELNAIADLTGTTGIVAVSAGNVHGRTIAVGSPLTISNANGTEGNPTINLASSGVSAATYGPMVNFTVDNFGRITDVTVTTTISSNAFVGGTLSGSALTVENDTSIGGDVVIEGTTNMKAVSATDVTFNNLTVGTKITTDTVTATTVETSILKATTASITNLTAGSLSFSDTSVSSLNATNLFAVSANATRLFKDGESVATSAEVATLSATMATSIANRTSAITSINSVVTDLSATMATSINNRTTAITSINTVVTNLSSTLATSIANVSALSKTNLDAITSINTVVGDLSSTMATSINNRTQAITSINTVVTNLSATMATSIANVSALSKTNLDAITSINTVIGNLSVNAITSINSKITNLSATMATSIANVSALTKTNLDAVTSINTVVGDLSSTLATSIGNRTSAITSINTVIGDLSSTLATSIANVSALSKTNLDAVTSINTVVGNLSSTMATSINNRTTAITSINTVVTNLSSTLATSIANVSALSKTNLDAITSINTVVGNLSSTLATSIANVSALSKTNLDAVTSINTVVGNLSSTLATSIGNRTSAITSINTVIGNLSSTMATSVNNRTSAITSINTVITNLSATLATSIANAGGATTSVSAFTVNALTVVSAVTGDLTFPDNEKAIFGTGGDLEIFHEGNHSFIVDNGTGDLYIRGSDNINIQADNGSSGWHNAIQTQFTGSDSKVAFFHGGTQVFSTLSNGISIDVDGGVRFEGATADSNETFLQVADPTADRTITLPDATGDVVLNESGTVNIESTDGGSSQDPNLVLFRNSSSPADFDNIGQIFFRARNDNSQDVDYAKIYSQVADASDSSEDAYLRFFTKVGGTDQEHFRIGFATTDFFGRVRLTGNGVFSNPIIIFEGSTANANETTLAVTDPTADRTVTLPDATGTVALTSDVATVSATMATSISNRTSAITSINSVITNLSSTVATSINNRTAAITSINTVVTNLSATMATSINTRTAAITSINTVITNLSATMATSIANAGGVDPIPFAIALG